MAVSADVPAVSNRQVISGKILDGARCWAAACSRRRSMSGDTRFILGATHHRAPLAVHLTGSYGAAAFQPPDWATGKSPLRGAGFAAMPGLKEVFRPPVRCRG
jgi:hypothetical protein